MSCITSAGVSWSAREVGWRVEGVTVLEGVTLAGEPGRVTGLLGPNGSGKTTFLSLLAGLRKPTTGTLEVGGRPLRRMRSRTRARTLALVEQHAQTGLALTVRQVVDLGRIPHRGRDAAHEDHTVVSEAMDLAEVTHLAGRSWATLSGGERQRVHLARALAQQPSLLLLDEPTNHLDLHHQIDFLSRIRALGVTTVAALHDLELAAAFCDDAVVLDRGRVVRSGPVEQVITPDLLQEVYRVDADVEPHPRVDRPHVRWTGLAGGQRDPDGAQNLLTKS